MSALDLSNIPFEPEDELLPIFNPDGGTTLAHKAMAHGLQCTLFAILALLVCAFFKDTHFDGATLHGIMVGVSTVIGVSMIVALIGYSVVFADDPDDYSDA